MNLRSDDKFVETKGWYQAAETPLATYACINYGEAYAPEEIADRSIVVDGDAGEMISRLLDSE